MRPMTEPGNGKDSPFGNGQGDVGGAAAMPNNLVSNPQSSAEGAKQGGGQPSSYGQSLQQKAGADQDINPQEIPASGTMLYADPKGTDAGNPIGTAAGASRAPYKGLK